MARLRAGQRDYNRSGILRCVMAVVAWAALAGPWGGQGASAQQPNATGRIVGVVRDSLGAAIIGAQLSVYGASSRAVSGADGRYTLANVATGAVRVDVRRLGFQPRGIEVRMDASGATTLDIVLVALPVSLPLVVVRDHREPSDARLAGFNARRTKGVGHFITREEITRRGGNGLIDLLRSEPSVRVTNVRGVGRSIVMRGMNCPPLMVIDGFPASAGPFDLDMIDVGTVEGIEIYSSGSSVPSELIGPRGLEQCGVIAIWSRPFRPRVIARTKDEEEIPIQPLLDRHAVYTAAEVDRVAAYEQGTATPLYPDSLWDKRQPGRVVAEFVVDTAGLVVARTAALVSSTDPALSEAVLKALSDARFRPAELKGIRVPQLVRMLFNFDPARPNVEHEGRMPQLGTSGMFSTSSQRQARWCDHTAHSPS